MKIKRIATLAVLLLVVAELILVLTSWLLSATMTEGVRSLLSDVGIRWFLGSLTTFIATPWLVRLLLLAMAGGCFWQSGVFRHSQMGYRERMGYRLAFIILVFYMAVVLALAAAPHAVLLSATGQLFPSPFSRALFPIASFGVIMTSAVYGWASGRFSSFSEIVDSLSFGIGKVALLIVLYMATILFYESLRFVFL